MLSRKYRCTASQAVSLQLYQVIRYEAVQLQFQDCILLPASGATRHRASASRVLFRQSDKPVSCRSAKRLKCSKSAALTRSTDRSAFGVGHAWLKPAHLQGPRSADI